VVAEDLQRSAVLGEAAVEACQRLGLTLAPDVLIVINRGVYNRLVEHELVGEEGVREALEALETVSAHLQETEERWGRNSGKTAGWWWDKLAKANETYFRGLYASTGIMIETLERNGLTPPSPQELGLQ
jgi:hypothetical protein